MEYLQTKKSRFVRGVYISPQSQSVRVMFSKRFDPEEDSVGCMFYQIIDGKSLPLPHPLGGPSKDGTLATFSVNPLMPPGTAIFFIVHASFFGGEEPFSGHGSFRVQGAAIQKFRVGKPHLEFTPPQEKIPFVFPTGSMQQDARFQEMFAEHLKAANDPVLTADFAAKNPTHPKVRQITMATTRRFRSKYPGAARQFDKEEQEKLASLQEKHTNGQDNGELTEYLGQNNPIRMSIEKEIERRHKHGAQNFEAIEDKDERSRRINEHLGKTRNQVMDDFAADDLWAEHAKAFAEHGDSFGIEMEQALSRRQQKAAQTVQLHTIRKDRGYGGTTSNFGEDMGPNQVYYPIPSSHIAPPPYNSGAAPPPQPPPLPPQQNNDQDDQNNSGNGPGRSRVRRTTPKSNKPKPKPGIGAAGKAEESAGKDIEKLGKSFFRRGIFQVASGYLIMLLVAFAIVALITGILDFTGDTDLTSANNGPGGSNSDNLTITKNGPASIQNGKKIDYLITASNQSGNDIQITDNLPANTTFDSADNNPDLEDANGNKVQNTDTNKDKVKTIIWSVSNDTAQQGVKLSLLPKGNNSWVLNEASAQETNSGSNNLGSGNEQPNSNTCSGKYTQDIQNNPLQANFGDPSCTFTRHGLRQILLQKDPQYAAKWYFMASCESSFDPNNYASQSSIGTPDSAGAWGLFQMGRGKNGQYDHGDVAWQKQTTNALTYNKNHDLWGYWATSSEYFEGARPLIDCHGGIRQQ